MFFASKDCGSSSQPFFLRGLVDDIPRSELASVGNMRVLVVLALVVGALAQDQTQSLGITTTAVPSATAPITPPAQRSLAACSADPLWRRLRNTEGLDPCALAMNLQRTCTTIDPIVALTGGESYSGPTSVEAATPCICTTVMYNLVAGCAACQHQLSSKVTRNWVAWSQWSVMCQNRSSILDGVWNRAILYNSTIPSWAYTKVFQSDYFDLQQAVNVGVSSTATPSSTSSSTSTPSTNATSTKISAIVGGALGGVGLILLVMTILFCYLRHRQRKWEESEGVNRPDSTFILGRPPAAPGVIHKDPTSRYGAGGLRSPSQDEFREKPRAVKTETALPDVLADEHRQGKPTYSMPVPISMPVPRPASNGNVNGGGYGPQGQYTPVPNPGVAGVGAGGRSFLPTNRVTPRDGPQGAAAQMLAADAAAAAKYRQGVFREDFSAEGNGYHSSTDGQSQLMRNTSTNRPPLPPSSYPYGSRNDNGKAPAPAEGYAADPPDEDVHAYSTVGDASISLYPSSAEHHADNPPPFVAGSAPSPIPEKAQEEYQLPDRGYTANSGGAPSPPLDADPFGANRRPTAFNRVFGERRSPSSGNMAGIGAGRGSSGNSPTSPGGFQARGGRASISPVHMRRAGAPVQDMGFGRQHHAAVGALGGPGHRDSAGLSEGSSSTAVGFPGDGSARGEGSPLPVGPFAGRSGFGVDR